MNAVLVEAITTRRSVRFIYNGKPRLVEPQCYGLSTRGNALLRAHQREGGTPEPLFDVAKMQGPIALDETFSRPGPNYKRDDSAMVTIFAQL